MSNNTEYDNLARQRNFTKGNRAKTYREGYAKIKWNKDKDKEEEANKSTGEGVCHTSSEKSTKD